MWDFKIKHESSYEGSKEVEVLKMWWSKVQLFPSTSANLNQQCSKILSVKEEILNHNKIQFSYSFKYIIFFKWQQKILVKMQKTWTLIHCLHEYSDCAAVSTKVKRASTLWWNVLFYALTQEKWKHAPTRKLLKECSLQLCS